MVVVVAAVLPLLAVARLTAAVAMVVAIIVATAVAMAVTALRRAAVATVVAIVVAAVAPAPRLAVVAMAVPLRLPPKPLPRPRLLRLPRLPAPDRIAMGHGPPVWSATLCRSAKWGPKYLTGLSRALYDRCQLGKVTAFKAGSRT